MRCAKLKQQENCERKKKKNQYLCGQRNIFDRKVSFHMPKKEKMRLEIKWKHYLYIHDLQTGNDPFGKSCSLP